MKEIKQLGSREGELAAGEGDVRLRVYQGWQEGEEGPGSELRSGSRREVSLSSMVHTGGRARFGVDEVGFYLAGCIVYVELTYRGRRTI